MMKRHFLALEYIFILIHGKASAKTSIYRERFMLMKQRVSRAEYFSRPGFDAETLQLKKREISSVQSLIVEMGRSWEIGLISQLEDGHFYLEDLSASVEVDLSKAISFFLLFLVKAGHCISKDYLQFQSYVRELHLSYLCLGPLFFDGQYKITKENTIILAEGVMKNGIFQVNLEVQVSKTTFGWIQWNMHMYFPISESWDCKIHSLTNSSSCKRFFSCGFHQ